MSREFARDPPTAADLLRLQLARRETRRTLRTLDRLHEEERRAACRRELATSVRSASPLLISLLAVEGLTLTEVAERFLPAAGWPRRPRASVAEVDLAASGSGSANRGQRRNAGAWPGIGLPLDGGGFAQLQVIAHSVEVAARIGGVSFKTTFGTLRIRTGEAVPTSIAIAGAGMPVDDLVSHAAIAGRGWRIVSIVPAINGTRIVVETGSTPFRFPPLV